MHKRCILLLNAYIGEGSSGSELANLRQWQYQMGETAQVLRLPLSFVPEESLYREGTGGDHQQQHRNRHLNNYQGLPEAHLPQSNAGQQSRAPESHDPNADAPPHTGNERILLKSGRIGLRTAYTFASYNFCRNSQGAKCHPCDGNRHDVARMESGRSVSTAPIRHRGQPEVAGLLKDKGLAH